MTVSCLNESDEVTCATFCAGVDSMFAVVKELLARDLVALDRVHADLFEGDALAGGFWSDIECEVDDELIGVRAIVERACHRLAIEGLVRDPVLGFLDHW